MFVRLYLERHKIALTVAGLVCLLVVIIAVISSVWPIEEKFFELGLLGKNKIAEAYFSNVHSSVDVGITNSWFIYVYNHMNALEEVSVRVKLLNSTMDLPDDIEHRNSQATSLAEFPLTLSVNETSIFPFYWTILDAESRNGSIIIKSIEVNDQPVAIDVSASDTDSFILVFELWIQNEGSKDYTFGWQSREGFSSASCYIGFKLNKNMTS